MHTLSFNQAHAFIKERIEAELDSLLPIPDKAHHAQQTLHEAMRYAALAGANPATGQPGKAKRLRPFMMIAAYVAASGELGEALSEETLAQLPPGLWRAAAALEMIHSYSLVHDDLPCMDDDALRYGQASCHARYGEAVAVLVGDALQAKAFEVLADDTTHPDAAVRLKLLKTLAQAAGTNTQNGGMVGGQALDMAFSMKTNTPPTQAEIVHMQQGKTGALFQACVAMGGDYAGASAQQLAALSGYAASFGWAYQALDDILDQTSTTEKMGKTAQKDAEQNKATLLAFTHLEELVHEVRATFLVPCGEDITDIFSHSAQLLAQLGAFAASKLPLVD